MMHFGNVHAAGDSVGCFANLKAVAAGTCFAATPDPDFPSGASLLGWGPVPAQILLIELGPYHAAIEKVQPAGEAIFAQRG